MKKFLVVFLTLAMILPIFSIIAPLSVSAATESFDTTDSGFKITGNGDKWADYYYESDKLLEEIPHTFEMWVKPINAKNNGVVIGNYLYATGYQGCINLYVFRNGYPRVCWNDAAGNEYIVDFTKGQMPIGEWSHVTIVFDDANQAIHYYLNGVLKESNTSKYHPLTESMINSHPFSLGGDWGRLSTRYFRGSLGDVSFYADVRTAAEIAADYANGTDLTDENLILHYDLSSADSSSPIIYDKSGNGYHQYRGQMWLTEAEMEALRGDTSDRAYSMVVVGDTQNLVTLDVTNGTNDIGKLYDWIVDNTESKNVQYVIGVGDITNDNLKAQWDKVAPAIKQMDGVVEYSLVRGNHDLRNNEAAMFEYYFGSHSPYTDQFDNHGGYYKAGSLANTYRVKTIGNTDYLFLNLDYIPSDDVLSWACSVVEKYPQHKVIISTHAYVYNDDTRYDYKDLVYADGDASQFDHNWSQVNEGDNIWTKLASRYENVQMVLCGHVFSDHIRVTQDIGLNGNTVTQMMINGQEIDKGTGGAGLVAILYFDESGENIDVEYYSTVMDRYFRSNDQFSLCLNQELEADAGWDGEELLPPEGFGTEEDPYIVRSASNLLWMSKAVGIGYAQDGVVNNPFAGKYFKQVCDIDLNGHDLPCIGYNFKSSSQMHVFGGTYDGGGYSIKNGTIYNPGTNHSQNGYWATGLFGAIYGADIRNIVMDNITINEYTSFGMIVGAAFSPDDATADFNVIENCTVKASCTIKSEKAAHTRLSSAEHWNHGFLSRVGAIVGLGTNVTINNCVNEADILATGNHSVVGGILGLAGPNVTVSNCSNSGDIHVDFTASGNRFATIPHANGGIVGAISGKSHGAFAAVEGMNILISDCTNSGSFELSGTATGPVYYGGILGVSTDLKADSSYVIECCTNSNQTVTLDSQADTVVSVAGIVGYAYHAADATSVSTLKLDDCASATLSASSLNLTSAYAPTNEYVSAVVNSGVTAPLTVLSHNWGDIQKHDAAQHKRACSCGCGETKYSAHNWGMGVVTLQPTHTAKGTMTYTCVGCGEVKTEEIATTTLHDGFGAWVDNGNETHTRTCSCGLSVTHACEDNKEGACLVCAVEPPHEHEAKATWTTDETNHWHECTGCEDELDKAAHADSDGNGKCDVCDYQMVTVTPDGSNTSDNPNTTDDPQEPDDSKDGLGTGAVIGIVSGSVVAVGIGGFALWWFVLKKKKLG